MHISGRPASPSASPSRTLTLLRSPHPPLSSSSYNSSRSSCSSISSFNNRSTFDNSKSSSSSSSSGSKSSSRRPSDPRTGWSSRWLIRTRGRSAIPTSSVLSPPSKMPVKGRSCLSILQFSCPFFRNVLHSEISRREDSPPPFWMKVQFQAFFVFFKESCLISFCIGTGLKFSFILRPCSASRLEMQTSICCLYVKEK